MLSRALNIRARRTIDRNLLSAVENPDSYSPEARTSINPVYPPFAQPFEARHAIREIYCRRLQNPDSWCAGRGHLRVTTFFFRSRTANYDDDNENDCGTGDHNDTDATNDDRGENHSDRQLGG
jgi:hypothetical protein